MKKVVVIGGGTGSFVALSGLKKFPVDLTAIVTVADSGGSTGRLRDEFGYLPPGDFRMALVALASDGDEDQVLRKLFLHRFSQGEAGLKGHNFGNLFLTALTDILGSEEKAINYASRILRVKGRVLPVTTESVSLVASYEDGSVLKGETFIDEPPASHDCTQRIKDLWLDPEAVCIPTVTRVLLEADMIVFGPGDVYTSVLANLVVKGVPEAIRKSQAQIIYVVNLMTKYGQTTEYKASDHVEAIKKYLGQYPDLVLVDNKEFPEDILDLYLEEKGFRVEDDLGDGGGNFRVIRQDLSSDMVFQKSPSDKLRRSLIRHDADKLAWELMKILKPF